MRGPVKTLLIGTVFALLLSTLLISGRDALAHGESSTHHNASAPVTSANPTTSYVYIAKPGDNLTLLVRRSLQLYSHSKNTVLSKAGLLYAETNTVKRLGATQLGIGERVNIPFSILQAYIVKSRTLKTADTAAWKRYIPRTEFTLKTISPVNLKAAQIATQPHTSSTSIEKPSTTEEKKHTFPWMRSALLVGLALVCIVWIVMPRDSQSQGKNAKVKR